MNVSKNGIDLIKQFEGCVLHAYPDPGTGAAPITIGWGSTRYITGEKIKMGDTITQQKADCMLEHEVSETARIIDEMNLGLNQNQFDACTSFAYNCGLGAFRRSTMLKRLRKGDFNVGNEFSKWVRAGGKVMQGLVSRRAAEKKLFETI